MEDDFQTPSTEIPKLLGKIDEGFDLVYGVRDKERRFARSVASCMTSGLFQRAMNAPLAGSITSFRAFRADLMRDYRRSGPPAVFLHALLDWTAQKVASVSVEHRPRGTGKSNYSWRKLIAHAVNMITGLSVDSPHIPWLHFRRPHKIASTHKHCSHQLRILNVIFALTAALDILDGS